MKTELEIANERILELEEKVKKLTSNTEYDAYMQDWFEQFKKK